MGRQVPHPTHPSPSLHTNCLPYLASSCHSTARKGSWRFKATLGYIVKHYPNKKKKKRKGREDTGGEKRGREDRESKAGWRLKSKEWGKRREGRKWGWKATGPGHLRLKTWLFS
jgi:hypothetical protein